VKKSAHRAIQTLFLSQKDLVLIFEEKMSVCFWNSPKLTFFSVQNASPLRVQIEHQAFAKTEQKCHPISERSNTKKSQYDFLQVDFLHQC
jgi:hypothetical protein